MEIEKLVKLDRTGLYDRRKYLELHLIGAKYWKEQYEGYRNAENREKAIAKWNEELKTDIEGMTLALLQGNTRRVENIKRLIQTWEYWKDEVTKLENTEYLAQRIEEVTNEWRVLHEELLIVEALLKL